MVSTQVDRINGLTGSVAAKAPVDVATTANILLSGEQIIDGITTNGTRVLVKNQTSPIENGIYTSSTGTWTRTSDFDGNRDAKSGTLVLVSGGTVNGSKLFIARSTSDPIIVGESAVTFSDYNQSVAGVLQVLLSGVATNDFIRYDGTNWVNYPLYSGTNVFTGANTFSGTASVSGKAVFPTAPELTIDVSGAITPTAFSHTVDTFNNDPTDNLSTINGGLDGQILFLTPADSARDIVLDVTGNIYLSGAVTVTLGTTSNGIFLIYKAAISKWIPLAYDYSAGGSGASGGMIPIKTVTVSSPVAAVDFVHGVDSVVLDATYKNYVIHYSNVIPVSDGVDLNILTSTDTGSSFDTGSSDYNFACKKTTAAGVDATVTNTGTTYLPLSQDIGSLSNEGCSGFVYINDPTNSATYTSFIMSSYASGTAGLTSTFVGSGARNSAANVDGVRFEMSTGDIASARHITLYGLLGA